MAVLNKLLSAFYSLAICVLVLQLLIFCNISFQRILRLFQSVYFRNIRYETAMENGLPTPSLRMDTPISVILT